MRPRDVPTDPDVEPYPDAPSETEDELAADLRDTRLNLESSALLEGGRSQDDGSPIGD
jgi:hypothetical protein